MTFSVDEVVAGAAARGKSPPAGWLCPDLPQTFPVRLQKRQTNIRVLQIAQPGRTFDNKRPS
jgi:hypothetical protein